MYYTSPVILVIVLLSPLWNVRAPSSVHVTIPTGGAYWNHWARCRRQSCRLCLGEGCLVLLILSVPETSWAYQSECNHCRCCKCLFPLLHQWAWSLRCQVSQRQFVSTSLLGLVRALRLSFRVSSQLRHFCSSLLGLRDTILASLMWHWGDRSEVLVYIWCRKCF